MRIICRCYAAGLDSGYIPTLSSLLRVGVFRGEAWTQYRPALIAVFWGIDYFIRHRETWDWTAHGSLLLVVSIWAAPYSWFTDEIVLAPAVLRAVYLSDERGRSLIGFGILDGAALALILWTVSLGSGAYVWTTTAWLAWYIYATRTDESQLDRIALAGAKPQTSLT